MPIYAYKCESCGFAKDALQKISDAPLTDCPACHAPSFKKQLTAAGFQLKGSGWYATDFKGAAPACAASSTDAAEATGCAAAKAAAPVTTATAAGAAGAVGGCSGSCASH